MAAIEPFWMVLGSGEPTYKHTTEAAAREEAARLANLNPGQSFTVLRAVATCTKQTVTWSLHRIAANGDEIPF